MKDIDGKRYCDRCGVLLDRNNNKCGFEICDKCNDEIEKECRENEKILSF